MCYSQRNGECTIAAGDVSSPSKSMVVFIRVHNGQVQIGLVLPLLFCLVPNEHAPVVFPSPLLVSAVQSVMNTSLITSTIKLKTIRFQILSMSLCSTADLETFSSGPFYNELFYVKVQLLKGLLLKVYYGLTESHQ